MPTTISPTIRVLSEQSANKIAAGEVIENSSSVVKELIDNALDSGASEVKVWIKAGGRQLIRVADDGCGMRRDDALLSLERHATSKIRSSEEITSVATMGFRGEAIPSIAAVSKFTLLTAPEGGSGTALFVRGGKIERCSEAARARGTTVEVESLFFNTPVRQKFQKSVASDVGAIHRMVTELALANPHVRFQLVNEGEELLSLSPGSLEVRIGELLGDPFARSLVAVGELGFIGKPSASRPNRLGQYLIINGRPVTSREISDAVREGYGTHLSPGRHPVFVLHLTLAGDEVDINVHPQKREVRLRSKEGVQEMLTRAIHRALHRAPVPQVAPSFSFTARETEEFDLPVSSQKTEQLFLDELPNILGTFKDYILVPEDDGLLLIHRKRAYARILYEEMIGREEGSLQLLLAPVTLQLPPREAQRLTEILEPLNAMGYSVRSFGPRSFLVEGIPPRVSQGAIEAIFQDLLNNLSGTQREKVALAAARAAAHHAPPPAGALVTALLQCNEPDFSPAGKPIRICISLSELKRKFHEATTI